MKYKNSYQENRVFEKKINHLQSFIGMPMWNGRHPTLSEIREFDRRLIEKQALGFKPKKISLLGTLFGRVKTNMENLFLKMKKNIKQVMPKQIKSEVDCCG